MFKSTKFISSVIVFTMFLSLISGLLMFKKQRVYAETNNGNIRNLTVMDTENAKNGSIMKDIQAGNVLYGDLNGDNFVDSIDVLLLKRYILGLTSFDDNQFKCADLNADNVVDTIDYNILRWYLLKIVNTIPMPTPTPTPTPNVHVADGYAAGTTGGEGGTIVTVTNATELRDAASSPSKMIITVDGNINLGSSLLKVTSNKTIQGKNSNSTIKGCISIKRVDNVIIRNLNITNPDDAGTGDGIEVSESSKVFITKCTFYDCADGSIDIVRASDFVTVSWCKFSYINQREHNFVNLIGNGDNVPTDAGKLHVTMHHNWYDNGCDQRMPRVRYGKVHVYNNYFGTPGALYNIGVGVYSQILVENNYFENQKNPWRNYSNNSNDQGRIQWNSGNVFINTSIPSWAPNSNVFAPPYNVSMDLGNHIKDIVIAGAGNR